MRRITFILAFLPLLINAQPVWKTSNQKEIDSWIQDQVTSPFQYYLMREDKVTTLAYPTAVDDTFAVVTAGHGFTAGGEYIVLVMGDAITQQEVNSVTNDTVGFDAPLSFAYTTAGTTVIRGVIDMNITGAQDTFKYIARGVTPLDIQSVIIPIWNDLAAGDDSKFGDLPALTNGLRVYKENDVRFGLGNYKSNSDFREFGATVNYNDRSGGGGQYGVDVVFDIKKMYGIVLRFDPDDNAGFYAIRRDDLSSLDRLRISILGQLTLGE